MKFTIPNGRYIISNDDLDDCEAPPQQSVLAALSVLICETSQLVEVPEPMVTTFYGEVSATWRNGDRIVRVACFPDRVPILQWGDTSAPLDSYESQSDPLPRNIAARLTNLLGD